jgi:lactate permease
VVIIAFCFGALLEALAGFGTPVAICGVMLVGLGFRPIKAVAVALVADTAPVAFGAIAIPIITLAAVTGLPKHALSQMVGRQVPFLAFLVPFLLVYMIDGRRGLRDSWPAALVAGGVFAVVQFVTSNFISTEVGWPGASQPPAPSDPGVTVSRHRALPTSTSVRADPLPLGEQAGLSVE